MSSAKKRGSAVHNFLGQPPTAAIIGWSDSHQRHHHHCHRHRHYHHRCHRHCFHRCHRHCHHHCLHNCNCHCHHCYRHSHHWIAAITESSNSHHICTFVVMYLTNTQSFVHLYLINTQIFVHLSTSVEYQLVPSPTPPHFCVCSNLCEHFEYLTAFQKYSFCKVNMFMCAKMLEDV